MTWFELDKFTNFGRNEVAKRSTTKNESEIDEIWELAQGSKVSTFATKKT